MVITDADRAAVLRDYRDMRRGNLFGPARSMRIVRDSYGAGVLDDLMSGREPWPPAVRKWAAAARYLGSMPARSPYWRKP